MGLSANYGEAEPDNMHEAELRIKGALPAANIWRSDSLPIRWKYRTALADKAEIAGK